LRPSPSDNHLPVTLSAFLSSGLARVAISVTASVAVMACAADDPVAAFGAALPCTLESRDLGIVLGTDTTATAPLVAPRLLRRATGEFLAAPMDGGRVLVWDSAGRELTPIGRPGEGPGELSDRGLMSLYLVEDDTLYVRD